MRNVHERSISAAPEIVGALLDALASPGDQTWPVSHWPPLVLDAGLAPGSRGGHGLIRYSVLEYEVGTRLRCVFDPGLGIKGYHELRITAEGLDRCQLSHVIEATLEGRMRLLWPLMIRWLHGALMEDLLDNAECLASGGHRLPKARWSPWVRLLRRVARLISKARPA